ncbi:aldehyde ferredoxin oxidoreductase [Chloroflexia bacterium SDU3-3]|nr:aldehyde ferredoxin oxidoreductase [Chloroflexia bacterium SDU3-3]
MPLRALRILLDTGTAQPETLPPAVEQEYLGGRGAAVWVLANRLPPNTGPLSRANLLVFSTGPLSGTGIGATGGFVVSTRSPLTGAIAHSWAHGSWGGALRRAGYDLLIIEGQSAEWCVLVIDGEKISFESAAPVLGADTRATDIALRQKYGEDAAVACVGPAGEAGVAYSSIVAEGRFVAEPAGTGSVMSSKHIKAIVVRGGAQQPLADSARAHAVVAALAKRAATSELAQGVRQFGSNYYLPFVKEWGALTGRNGQDGRAQQLQAITRTTLAQRGKRESFGCDGCPIPCYSHYVRKNGEPMAYPELEAVAGFGGRCGLTNPDALIFANDLCQRLGLDVASTSAAIAFMLECQQEGLSRAGTLTWGDDEAIFQAIQKLGQKQEKRDLLSLGVGEMQEVFFGSAAFAPQVKGLAMPALDPRALNEIALSLASASIGGDYRYSMCYEEMLPDPPSWLPDEPSHPQAVKGKASRLIWHERFAAALDAAGFCRRLSLLAYQSTPADLAELLSAALGRAITGQDLARIGERIVTVERQFMRTYSTVSSEDKLPARWRDQALKDGRAAGHLPALEDLLAEYYKRHGWDENGDPTPKRLAELGL